MSPRPRRPCYMNCFEKTVTPERKLSLWLTVMRSILAGSALWILLTGYDYFILAIISLLMSLVWRFQTLTMPVIVILFFITTRSQELTRLPTPVWGVLVAAGTTLCLLGVREAINPTE